MDILFVDKPAGATTHTSLGERERSEPLRETNDGICEYLSARSGLTLLVSHRLDRETTGCLAFARTAEAAEALRQAFAERRVSKRYLFLTDRPSAHGEAFTRESQIERQGSTYVSTVAGVDPNSRTAFRLVDKSHGLFLWEARPETGKPHQIRLHAADAGIPILGDLEHGGSAFAALCLHSESLKCELANGEVLEATQPAPRWFTERELCQDSLLMRWLSAIDRRERLVRSWQACGDASVLSAERTLRWLHSECDPLRGEQLGGVMWLSWYRESEPSQAEWQSLKKLAEVCAWPIWSLQMRADRGRSAENPFLKGELPPSWVATEGDLRFEMRASQGLSPGLFLDQRQNRAWVRKQASGLKVLNLFCYTGGFSVAASKGGAAQVVSVDLSKNFLEWAKNNFALNDLPLEAHEFRAIDSFEYLNWARKKELKFDLIVCDPPSFSRSEKGVFKIERDLEKLLAALIAVTQSGGRILFSCNYEGWDTTTLARRLELFVKQTRDLKLARTPSPDWDFELPVSERNMKSVLIEVR